jgi:hypothetical protein
MGLRFGFLLLIGGLSVGPAESQDFVIAQSQTEERAAGLLALPEVFGEYPCELFEPKKLDLYAAPSKQRPPIATIERRNPPRPPVAPDCEEPQVVVRGANGGGKLPSDETGYEYLKAVVYEQAGNWFRIAMPKGSAWIERGDSDGFFSYPEDLTEDGISAYLRSGWDGNTWAAPGSGTSVAATPAWRAFVNEEIPVRVLATRVVRGEKWIHLRFENEVCGKSNGNLPPHEGWLPAYRTFRETSVWFYSRGC